MSVYVNSISVDLERVIKDYSKLNDALHLDIENGAKLTFDDHDELIRTLTACRSIIISTLKVYTYLLEGTIVQLDYEKTRDLYKRSQIKVTYAIIYHDLKNVFEILDIAASSRSSTVTVHNITEQDLENIYVSMLSFIIQTVKAYNSKFVVGGSGSDESRKKRSIDKED